MVKLLLFLTLFTTALSPAAEPISISIRELASQAAKEQHIAGRSARLNQLKALQQLKERCVRESRLKDGVAVEEEINRLKEENLRFELLLSIVGIWEFTTTKNSFHIFADGTMASFLGETGKAEVIDTKKRILRLHGIHGIYNYRITEDGKLSVDGVKNGSKHPARRIK